MAASDNIVKAEKALEDARRKARDAVTSLTQVRHFFTKFLGYLPIDAVHPKLVAYFYTTCILPMRHDHKHAPAV